MLDVLRHDVEDYIWTFRWLWLINIAALVRGIMAHNMELLGFSAVSAIVSIVGIARTRRGRKLVARAENVCLPQADRQAQA